jgi:hypothetical protein
MSPQILLLRKYKNELLTIIQESGFDPNFFIAEDKAFGIDEYFTITLRDSPIFFAVRAGKGSFDSFLYIHSEFQLNFPRSQISVSVTWEYLAARFKYWLNNVVKAYLDEINAPDLWQILEEARSHVKDEIGTPKEFEPFSDEEKIRVRLSLNDFRLLIVKNFSPNKEELKSIDARLEHLSDALDKHNKFDWKGIAINTVIAIGVALSLSPEQGHQLFVLFKQVFSNIIYLLP